MHVGRDGANNDVRALGETNGKIIARLKQTWQNFLRNAMTQKGPILQLW
jgi:hypothetical protein